MTLRTALPLIALFALATQAPAAGPIKDPNLEAAVRAVLHFPTGDLTDEKLKGVFVLKDNTQGKGRDFGLDLYPTRLFSVIQRVKQVKSVSYLAVNGLTGVDLNRVITVPKHGLVYGATNHEINVVPYREP